MTTSTPTSSASTQRSRMKNFLKWLGLAIAIATAIRTELEQTDA